MSLMTLVRKFLYLLKLKLLNNGYIYTVTTLMLKESGEITRSRTPGFYFSEKAAEQCIRQNTGDIYEIGYYNYAVIEKMSEGLYPMALTGAEERWFKVVFQPGENWRIGTYQISETERPKFLERMFNFSNIG